MRVEPHVARLHTSMELKEYVVVLYMFNTLYYTVAVGPY